MEDKLETFDFTVLTSRTEHMQKRNRVIIEDKDGQYREFIIYNISSDLNGYTRVQTNASALEDIKTAKPVGPHKLDKHTVKQALEYALADTGWEVSDEAEWGGTRTTSWTGWHDRISILKQLETTYDMRLSFYVEVGSNKITNRYVSLNKVEPMFNGEEIVYGDNMIDLKRTVDFSDIATALICLGPEDSETGKREIVEVKDDDAQAQFGLPYRYIWDIYEPQSNDEKMTRKRLTTLGRTALNKRKQESISYEIDGIGLSASAGDMIRVKNEDFTPELYVDAEVVEVTTDLISGESNYKFGVIKEYTRDDVYARFNAMLSGLRERLNKVVENTDSIISERLEEELKYVERYIEKSPTPPLNAKEGQLWLDTSHDGVAVLKRYENGQWIKSSVDNVKEIGGMTREETMFEALKERLVRNEVDYSEVFKRHRALVSEKHYHYVDEDIKNDLTNRYNSLQQSYDDFKIAFNNINSEQPTIGLITTAISRAVEFEARLKEYNDSYYIARKSFDEVIALLQSQYSDEKYNELLNDIADSVGGIVQDDGSIDMSEVDRKRLDEAMELVAGAIGGTWNGNQLIADVPNREELNDLNKSIKQYLNGELSSLDGKLGKQIEAVINQAKDEFSVAIDSVDKKISGIEVGGRNLLRYSTQKYLQIPNRYCTGIVEEEGKRALLFDRTNNILYLGGRDSYLEKGKTYTFSFYAKASEELEFTRGIYINSGNSGFIPDTKITTDWERYSFTFTASKNDSVGIHMYPRINNNDGTYKSFYITDWQLEKGTVTTDVTPALEDVESDINNLSQEVTKNTTSLNVLENEISLKADSDTVKQILDDELEPIQSSVQSNKAELKVQADLIASKVDSSTYEADKDGIVKDIETNASAIEQTSKSLTSNIDSVNKRIDEQESIIDTNKSSISQLNNQIALKVDSSTVKQMLDSELNAVKSNVQTNQSELKLLSNQISSKVEKSEYTTDMNGITRDISNTKSELNQLSDSVNSKITSVEQKFDELNIEGRNLVLKSDVPYSNSNYLIADYTLSKPMEVGKTYTITIKGNVENTGGGLAILRDNGRYFMSSNASKISDNLYQVTVDAINDAFDTDNIRLYNYPSNSRISANIEWIKLEEGNKGTPYTLAPEDVQEYGNILTKHETEIEQNKLGLNTKVGYSEMNGTNKTLEKLLTEFSQTSSGFNFKVDSNGMIQDLTFDRYRFKLNSNLIEFNDGDVVIKDGVTTIKDAFIHNLASNNAFIQELASDTAFIDVLNSQHINSNEVISEIGDNKTTIHGGFFESSGTYRRTWLGNTSTSQVDIRVENGYVRARNNTRNWSLYFSDFGISTYADATGNDDVSGSLIFRDTTYSTASSLMAHSTYGVVALQSEYNAVIIAPENTSRNGNNIFKFDVKLNDSASDTDGWIAFGSPNTNYSTGIRFQKTTSGQPTVYVTNGNGDIGTGDISVMNAEVRGQIRSLGHLNIKQWNNTRAFAQIGVGAVNTYNSVVLASHSGGNAYLGVGGYELRVTNNNGYNGGNTDWRDIRFGRWNAMSHEKFKYEIKEWNTPILDLFKEIQLYSYKERHSKDKFSNLIRRSIVLRDNPNEDEFPVEWRTEDGFDGNEVMWWNTKAIQELAHENDKLKSEIKELNSKIDKIMEMIA